MWNDPGTPPISNSAPAAGGIAAALVGFCRFARSRGLKVGVQETLDSLETARLALLPRKDSFRLALRALLSTSRDDRDLFDRLFEVYWEGAEDHLENTPPQAPSRRPMPESSANPILLMASGSQSEEPLTEGKTQGGASAGERLQRTDFSKVPLHDQEALEQLALRLWRRMSRRLARRLKTSPKGRLVHLRTTIRRSIPHGGDPIELNYRSRKPRRPRLVMLLDVSGSMDRYSFFLLRFVYALQKHFQRVDSFAFSTRLIGLNQVLDSGRLGEALTALSTTADNWSSGTRIGTCLREFNRTPAGRALSRRSLVILLSDGLDTGEPGLLSRELKLIKRRARKLIWLNPLLGMKGYQPLTRGIQAALPLIDVFLPAHNLDSLVRLERHLSDV